MALQLASQFFPLTTSLFHVAFFAFPVVVSDFEWFILARSGFAGLVLVLLLL